MSSTLKLVRTVVNTYEVDRSEYYDVLDNGDKRYFTDEEIIRYELRSSDNAGKDVEIVAE